MQEIETGNTVDDDVVTAVQPPVPTLPTKIKTTKNRALAIVVLVALMVVAVILQS